MWTKGCFLNKFIIILLSLCLLQLFTSTLAEASNFSDSTPEILNYIYEYCLNCEDDYCFQVAEPPAVGYIDGTYRMSMTCDEVPEANGKAILVVNEGSSSVYIEFHYSKFMGIENCAPGLIRDVTQAVVKAIAEKNGILKNTALVDDVIASYSDTKYTHVVEFADYAVVFTPAGIFAAELAVVNKTEFQNGFEADDYKVCDLDYMYQKLNEGSKCCFSGKVMSNEAGDYKNSFSEYKCLMIESELPSGETITITQFPDKVPVNIDIGDEYIFYGTPMFDVSGNLLFYLHSAEKSNDVQIQGNDTEYSNANMCNMLDYVELYERRVMEFSEVLGYDITYGDVGLEYGMCEQQDKMNVGIYAMEYQNSVMYVTDSEMDIVSFETLFLDCTQDIEQQNISIARAAVAYSALEYGITEENNYIETQGTAQQYAELTAIEFLDYVNSAFDNEHKLNILYKENGSKLYIATGRYDYKLQYFCGTSFGKDYEYINLIAEEKK